MGCGKGLFITGTDTGCGKTEFTLALMHRLQAEGLSVLGMKPVAAGAQRSDQGLRNEDALRIQEAGSVALPYELINPYVFAPAIAPHLAAAEAGARIEIEVIENCFAALSDFADVVLVEGVGGWRVPLSPQLEVADLPLALNLPVLLVVGLRLGCLNHALLSADGILESGAVLRAWVANALDPLMQRPEDNVLSLQQRIAAPLLTTLPFLPAGAPASQRTGDWHIGALSQLLPGCRK
jgi:dethiobiotin synthetase